MDDLEPLQGVQEWVKASGKVKKKKTPTSNIMDWQGQVLFVLFVFDQAGFRGINVH